MVINLKDTAIAAKLSWHVLGVRGRLPRATLSTFVGPKATIIGAALSDIVDLMEDWSLDGRWGCFATSELWVFARLSCEPSRGNASPTYRWAYSKPSRRGVLGSHTSSSG